MRLVLRGGLPKVVFLESLTALEAAYAREIEAFERGDIVVRGRRRYVWVDLRPALPDDLAQVSCFSRKA